MLHISMKDSFKIAKQFLVTNSNLLQATAEGTEVFNGNSENNAVIAIAELIRIHYRNGICNAADKISHITSQLTDVGIYQLIPHQEPNK